MLPASVQLHIEALLNCSCIFTPIGGGSINAAYQVKAGPATYFCKINTLTALPGLFAAEQQGLELLAQQPVMRTSAIIACGHTEDHQFLLLEWIEQGLKTTAFWQQFGEQLAALHHISSEQFGLPADNFMGSLPQRNTLTHSWTNFFQHQRLEPQVQLAVNHHLLSPAQAAQFEKLYHQLSVIFPNEPPALVHGDLWSGNFLCDRKGNPVLIDPAVYYGHRSMDIAMTTLFGGFEAPFYESYHYHYPLPDNYREQWAVCNLYPLLIHLNLFGKSYLADILNTIRRY